jgi:ATP-dependent helicase/nuclease subunit A
MTLSFIPADQDTRCRIRDSLDENLLVEAGAGTGKTTSLVERVVRLIATGRATPDRVAAIIFP